MHQQSSRPNSEDTKRISISQAVSSLRLSAYRACPTLVASGTSTSLPFFTS